MVIILGACILYIYRRKVQKRKGFLQLSSIYIILSFETFHSLFSLTYEAYLKEISVITRKIEKWTRERRLIIITSYLPL